MASMQKEALIKIGFFVGILIYFSEGVNYAQHAPFFPNKAKEKGSSVTWVGIISSGFDISAIVFALILPFVLDATKGRTGFLLGSFLAGVACFTFAFTELIPNVCVFNLTCLLIRAVLGAASCFIWGFGFPIFTAIYPEQSAMVIGVIEGAYAAGLMAGPAFGSFLYSIGGFKLPFLASGLFEIFLTILSLLLLPNPHSVNGDTNPKFGTELEKLNKIDKEDDFLSPQKENNFLKFISRPGIILASIPYAASCCVVGYIDVSVSPHLLEVYDVDGNKSGYIFLVYAIAYTLACPIVSTFISIGSGSYVYSMSSPLTGVTFLVLFLPLYIPKLEQLIIVIISLGTLGVCFAMTSVPILLIVEKTAIVYDFSNMKSVKLFAANWWNLLFFSGRLFGAFILGGLILDVFDFYWTNLIIANLMLILGLMTLLALRHMNLLTNIS